MRIALPLRLMPSPDASADITRDFQRVMILLPAEDSTPAIVVVTDRLTREPGEYPAVERTSEM